VSWAVVATALVAGTRLVARSVWLKRHRAGAFATRIVLAGSLSRCRQITEHLMAHPELELEAVGIASDEPRDPTLSLAQVPIEEVAALALSKQAERILMCAALSDDWAIDRMVSLLAPFPLEVQLVPDLMQFPFLSLDGEDLAGIPALNLSASPMTSRDLMIKRLEDIILSVLILLLISPLLVIIAAAVRCSGRGPILFAQRRHGLLGKTITVYKFRTMTWSPEQIPEPDDARATDAAQRFLNPRTGAFKQAKAGDSRLTPLGHLLRTTSLDELPQFFNVLRGDMSIVGPRPHARLHNLQFVDQVPGLMWRHYVKPGITGLAQISGARGRTRDVGDMERRVNLDLQYIRDWSLWLDLRIIAATILFGFYNREP
jgi:putative colanic acid biosysnthesis UDP-glucose lipid carrier transferase